MCRSKPCKGTVTSGAVYGGVLKKKKKNYISCESNASNALAHMLLFFCTLEHGSWILVLFFFLYFRVNRASKRLIKSVEESKCAVAQQAPKAFWVGV